MGSRAHVSDPEIDGKRFYGEIPRCINRRCSGCGGGAGRCAREQDHIGGLEKKHPRRECILEEEILAASSEAYHVEANNDRYNAHEHGKSTHGYHGTALLLRD